MRSTGSTGDRFDLLIDCNHVIIVGWRGVGDVEVEHRHNIRVNSIDAVEIYVVVIWFVDVSFLQLLHAGEARRHEVLIETWVVGCIGDLAFDNIDVPNDRTRYGSGGDVRRGGAYTVANKHRIVVRYGLDER
jgi:hypothetical protein